jgi:lysophospholipase L1-like esterase
VLMRVVVLALVDVLAGSLLPQPQLPPWTQPTEEVRGTVEPGVPDTSASTARSALVSTPALRDAPWSTACLREYDRLAYDYVQFVVRRVRDATGSCVSVRNGERAGYQAPLAGLQEVWLLGGSAAFGEGQRDGHTIASELTRQSERDGRPVQVRNLAVPGMTAYQEALLLEQRLAVEPAPALVVFYDGANDLAAQLLSPTESATWLPAELRRSENPAGTRSLWSRWRGNSLVMRSWDWLSGGVAAASPLAVPEQAPNRVAHNALKVYQRGIALAARIGQLHGVQVIPVFQTVRFGLTDPVASRMIAGLPTDVIDLSDALGRASASTYFDGVHTNERGAALVAETLRRRLSGTVLAAAGT